MKKFYLFLASFFMIAMSANATVAVCDVNPDENGHFNCPYITSGTITWDANSRTLTLNNAVVDYSSESPYDYVYPIRITEDATIVIQGECRLTTTGFVAMAFEGTDSKTVTIQGDGSLSANSMMRGIYLVCTRLTIKDIILQARGIMNNGHGELCALKFDNVQAEINGVIDRIAEGITFNNCAITEPEDAYVAPSEYGYYIAEGNGDIANHIIISRIGGSMKGDVNNDGEVNIADVNALISMILGGASYQNADVNGDGEVNIADVNAVINIILYGPEPDAPGMESFTVNGVTFNMVNVEGGTFTMGATPEQGSDAGEDEYPAHQVTLSSFSIGEMEVTQALWVAVMGNNPSFFQIDDLNLPVEQVTWNDCQEFITKLNQMTGRHFRLPTEAEWEYAARGGKKSKGYKYSGSNDVDEVAWYWLNCGSITHPVGSKKANELGLYDMSGNVQEWCNDVWSEYTEEAQTNPTGPTTGSYRIVRGGTWGNSNPASCRVSCRSSYQSGYGDYIRGLRLAL